MQHRRGERVIATLRLGEVFAIVGTQSHSAAAACRLPRILCRSELLRNSLLLGPRESLRIFPLHMKSLSAMATKILKTWGRCIPVLHTCCLLTRYKVLYITFTCTPWYQCNRDHYARY